VIVQRQEDKHAAVVTFVPGTPLRGQPNREILDGDPLKRVDGHDGDLRARFLIYFLAQPLELRSRLRVERAPKIVDVAARTQTLDFFGACGDKP
jgi:hypothetical protein